MHGHHLSEVLFTEISLSGDGAHPPFSWRHPPHVHKIQFFQHEWSNKCGVHTHTVRGLGVAITIGSLSRERLVTQGGAYAICSHYQPLDLPVRCLTCYSGILWSYEAIPIRRPEFKSCLAVYYLCDLEKVI